MCEILIKYKEKPNNIQYSVLHFIMPTDQQCFTDPCIDKVTRGIISFD